MSRSIRARARAAGLILFAAAMAALTALFAGPTAASADVIGGLTVAPAAGSDLIAPVVTTSAGCPATADGYNALLSGPVFTTPYLIAYTQDVGFSTTAGFPVQLSDSFKDAATEAGVVLEAGDYTVTVQCVDTFRQDVKGAFSTIVRFTSPTAWITGVTPSVSASSSTSATPSAGTSPSVSVSPSVSTSPSASASASASPSPSVSPSPSGTGADPTDGPAGDPTDDPVTEPAGNSLPVTGPPSALLGLLGAILLTAGIVLVCAVDPAQA